MPLNKGALKAAIKAGLQKQGNKSGDWVRNQGQHIEEFAADLSNAIDAFVRSGDVITTVNTTTADIDAGGDPGIGTGQGGGKGKVT